MKKYLSACLALLLLLLSACGSEDAPGGEAQAAGTPSNVLAPGNSEPAAAGWETFSFATEAPSSQGCYLLRRRPRAEHNVNASDINILYLDYTTGQLVYLCNRPECTHDNETCTSYRADGTAGSLACYQGRVYTLPAGAGPDFAPMLAACDEDGANPRDLLTLESGSALGERFAADGEALYTLQSLYTENAESAESSLSYHLVRIGLADGVKTSLNEKDYSNATLLSGVGNEVVLYSYTVPPEGGNITGVTILGVDKRTGAERVIYELPSGDIVGAKGGCAYVLRMEDGAIDAVDLATGTVQSTGFDRNAVTLYSEAPDVTGLPPEDAEYILANPPKMYYCDGIFDGKLFLRCTEDQNRETGGHQLALYAIGLTTGEVRRVTLSIGFETSAGSPVFVIAEAGEDFLVMRDFISTPYQILGSDGELYETAYTTNQYALISKADFYASNPNYRDFVLS